VIYISAMLEGMAGDCSGNILTYSFLFFLFYLLPSRMGRGVTLGKCWQE